MHVNDRFPVIAVHLGEQAVSYCCGDLGFGHAKQFCIHFEIVFPKIGWRIIRIEGRVAEEGGKTIELDCSVQLVFYARQPATRRKLLIGLNKVLGGLHLPGWNVNCLELLHGLSRFLICRPRLELVVYRGAVRLATLERCQWSIRGQLGRVDDLAQAAPLLVGANCHGDPFIVEAAIYIIGNNIDKCVLISLRMGLSIITEEVDKSRTDRVGSDFQLRKIDVLAVPDPRMGRLPCAALVRLCRAGS